MPVRRRFPAFRTRGLGLPLAAVLALAACRGEVAPPETTTRGAAQTASAPTIPAPPEPFHGAGCGYLEATYTAPGYAGSPRYNYAYTLRFLPLKDYVTTSRAVFEARDPRSGALVTTVELERNESNGVSVSTLSAPNPKDVDRSFVFVRMEELNRDFSQGSSPAYTAPYAIVLSDLVVALYYLDWTFIAGHVTYHTPERAEPLFPNVWLLSRCGPPRAPR